MVGLIETVARAVLELLYFPKSPVNLISLLVPSVQVILVLSAFNVSGSVLLALIVTLPLAEAPSLPVTVNATDPSFLHLIVNV